MKEAIVSGLVFLSIVGLMVRGFTMQSKKDNNAKSSAPTTSSTTTDNESK